MNIKTICSLFGCQNAHTDEEYCGILRRRQRIFIAMLLLGVVTFAAAGAAELFSWNVALDSHALGFYSGIGTGMAFGAATLLIRLRRTMKDPDALRKARIRDTDERVAEIGRRATATAGYTLLIAVYLLGIIGGMFYPQLLILLAVLPMIFLLAYLISAFIYNKIM